MQAQQPPCQWVNTQGLAGEGCGTVLASGSLKTTNILNPSLFSYWFFDPSEVVPNGFGADLLHAGPEFPQTIKSNCLVVHLETQCVPTPLVGSYRIDLKPFAPGSGCAEEVWLVAFSPW